MHVKVYVFSHRTAFLYPNFNSFSLLSQVDDLIAQLEDLQETSLLTLKDVDAAVDSLLVHEDVVDHFKLSFFFDGV